jgi:hypothetical protein
MSDELQEAILEDAYRSMTERLEGLHTKRLRGYCILVTFDLEATPKGKFSLDVKEYSRLGSHERKVPVEALWAAVAAGNILLGHIVTKHDPTFKHAAVLEGTT